MVAWHWPPPFHSAGHEARYAAQQAGSLARQDRWGGAWCTVLWLGAVARYLQHVPARNLARISQPWAFLLLLLNLGPRVFGSAYPRVRVWYITAIRLVIPALLQQHSFMAVLQNSPAAFPAASPRQLALLVLMARLPTCWFVALSFRLPFALQLLVDGAVALLTLRGLPAKCATLALQPHGEAFFSTGLRALHRWAHALPLDMGLGRALGPPDSTQLCAPGGACACGVVVGWVTLVFGYLLPSVAVAALESKARSQYLVTNIREGGWEEADVVEYLVFNWPLLGLRLLCMVPALLVAAWAIVIWVVAPPGAQPLPAA